MPPTTTFTPAIPKAYLVQIIWVKVDALLLDLANVPPILPCSTTANYEELLNINLSKGFVFLDSKIMQSTVGTDNNLWVALKLIMAKY